MRGGGGRPPAPGVAVRVATPPARVGVVVGPSPKGQDIKSPHELNKVPVRDCCLRGGEEKQEEAQ